MARGTRGPYNNEQQNANTIPVNRQNNSPPVRTATQVQNSRSTGEGPYFSPNRPGTTSADNQQDLPDLRTNEQTGQVRAIARGERGRDGTQGPMGRVAKELIDDSDLQVDEYRFSFDNKLYKVEGNGRFLMQISDENRTETITREQRLVTDYRIDLGNGRLDLDEIGQEFPGGIQFGER